MGERRNRVGSKVARVLTTRPDRVAAAWRRVRFTEATKGQVPDNLLDDVVENFVREIGNSLAGVEGHAWSRTRGVLRLSTERGIQALYAEFTALRRCLVDAVEVLGGNENDRTVIHALLDEAVQSSTALFARLTDPLGTEPAIPFGGIVLEYFERPRALQAQVQAASQLH